MAEFNWNDLKKAAEDAGFVVVPQGKYDAVVSKATAGKSSQGKDQIKVTFKITTGPYAGKPVNTQFTISADNAIALGFFFRHMAALGLDGNYFARVPAPDLSQVANDILGKNCQIEVSVKPWNGEDRNQIDSVKPASGAVPSMGKAAPQPAMAQPQPVAQPQPQPAPAAAPQPQPVAEPETPKVEETAEAVAALPELPF